MSSKTKTKTEVYDVIVPVEFTTRLTVSNNFPNKRSKVQRRALDELRRFLGKENSLSDAVKFGRAHSRKVSND